MELSAANSFDVLPSQAFVGPDGVARLFRPDLNMQRMIRSTDRVALPVRSPLQKFHDVCPPDHILFKKC